MVSSGSNNRRRTKLVTVRVLPAEKAELELEAKQRGVSLGHLVRLGLRQALDMPVEFVAEKCSTSPCL